MNHGGSLFVPLATAMSEYNSIHRYTTPVRIKPLTEREQHLKKLAEDEAKSKAERKRERRKLRNQNLKETQK